MRQSLENARGLPYGARKLHDLIRLHANHRAGELAAIAHISHELITPEDATSSGTQAETLLSQEPARSCRASRDRFDVVLPNTEIRGKPGRRRGSPHGKPQRQGDHEKDEK